MNLYDRRQQGLASCFSDEVDRLVRVTGEAYFVFGGDQNLSHLTGGLAIQIPIRYAL